MCYYKAIKRGAEIQMRSEKEMFELFLNIADSDDRIAALYMNGSRTNPNVPKDIFQDYDIVYVVSETQSFISDKNWIEKFGEILYMQYPDEFPEEASSYEHDKDNFYGWLMQFKDGSRIDLHVESVAHAREHILDDGLCKVLLDKYNVLPEIPESSDKDYWVKKPSEEQFDFCCNEFWWCTNNLAKGLWRGEILYVHDMADAVVRKQLDKMLCWKAGVRSDFCVSVGKSSKYLYKWLDGNEYRQYLDTFFAGDISGAWSAVLKMCDLFEKTALFVAEELGYTYNRDEAAAARGFLEHVKRLPENAEEIF